MSDITLTTIASGYNLGKINENFAAIQESINEDVLHLEGGNNILRQNLDINNQRLLNLPDPVSASEPMTKRYGDVVITEAEAIRDETTVIKEATLVLKNEAVSAATSASNSADSALASANIAKDYPEGLLAAALAEIDSTVLVGGIEAKNLRLNANIENYGADTSALASTNTAAISAAVSANGKAIIPKRSAPFLTTLTSSFDFSTVSGDGVLQLASGALIDLSKAFTPIANSSPSALMSQYASGSAVEFTAYGDSIVESVGSTGYTPNSGLDTFAPDYAWPTLVSHLARQQNGAGSGDLNFKVNNAGYGGQQLQNGWAFDNFKSKVLDVYDGTQCLIIAFGHNDGYVEGSATLNYIKQLRNLIILARGNGIEPVLLTTIPCGRPRSQDIFNEIKGMQSQICDELNVQCFNVYDKYLRAANYHGYFNLFTADGVHPNDSGYRALSCAIYSELFRDWVVTVTEMNRKIVSLWEPQAKGLVFAGNTDASWAEGATYLKNASSVGLNIFYSTAKGANEALAAMYVYNDSSRPAKLIYRALFPAENTDALTGLNCNIGSLTDGMFYTPSGITYTNVKKVGGTRRGVIPYNDAPCIVYESLQVGMTFVVLGTGSTNSALRYASNFEVNTMSAGAGFKGQSSSAISPTNVKSFNYGASYYKLQPSSEPSAMLEDENLELTNIVSYVGAGTQMNINASLAEGDGFIVMSGDEIQAGVNGKWFYALVRGLTGHASANDPTKLYLISWRTSTGAVVVQATSIATIQSWADISFFVSMDYDTNSPRLRVWDGGSSSAPLMLTYTSAAATSGTTTQVECIPVAGAAGGGVRIGVTTGSESPILIKSFLVSRYL